MNKFWIGLLVGVALLVPNAAAQDLKTERYTLRNGMTVLLHEDARTPNVTVNFLVKVGSKDEQDRRSGFAHLFEHLMFMGTKRVPQGQYDKIIESYGGSNNAFTAPDMTLYYSSAPARALPTLLWLEADRLEALGENIDQKKLDLQRAVVLNERRQNTENSPYGEADEAVNQLVYPSDHPYHRGTIGQPVDLNAATLADVKAFFATYYVPNNISLLVAGNFKSATVKPLIEQLFGGLARKNDTLRKSVPAKVNLGVQRVTYVDRVSQPRINMVWRVPKVTSPEFGRLDVITTLLQSRINTALLDTGIASDAYTYVDGGLLESKVFFAAFPGEDVSLAQLEARMDAVLTEFAKNPPTPAELKAAVNESERLVLESLQDLVNRAQVININSYYYDNPNYAAALLAAYAKYTPQELAATARAQLPLNERLIQTVVPAGRGSDASARDARPADLGDAAYAFPTNTQFKLNNGISITYWQSAQFPLTYLGFSSLEGTAGESVRGSTQLVAALLDKGSKTRNFSGALKNLGASLSASASARQLVVNASTLTRNLEPSLALFTEALSAPLMTADEFGVEQSNLASDRESLPDNPRALSLEIAMNAYYGPSHPFGRFLTPTQVKAVKLEDVKNRYNIAVNPVVLRVFVAGDAPVNTVRASLEKTLGAWRLPSTTVRVTPRAPVTAPTPGKARLLIVDQEGSPQTFIRVFTPSVGYAQDTYLAQNTLAVALGGTFTSRLNTNLREDKGYTYGIASGIIDEGRYGILNTRTAVESSVTGDSIKEILGEFKLLGSDGISAEETTKSTQSQLADTLQAFATPAGIVGTATYLDSLGRTMADYVNLAGALPKLTQTGVNASAKTAMNLENAVWVLVGDKKKILPQLEGLGLPTPEDAVIPE